METRNEYFSPVVVHPGVLVEDWMDEKGVTASEMALRAGLSETSIRQIAAGWEDITPGVAAALERATGISANFWMRAQKLYEEDLERLYDDKSARHFARLTGQVWIMRGRPVPKAELAPAGV